MDRRLLAYAENIRSFGEELDTFVTNDRDILKKSDEIEKLLELRPEEPS